MSSRASVEIWQTILDFTISVPFFFHPDPLDTYGVEAIPRYFHEGAYWESERTRNSLRRVCRSWDNYLSSQNHRFICLADVQHGRVPFNVLPTAIRLNIAPDDDCLCAEFCVGSRPTTVSKLMEMWKARLWSCADVSTGGRAIGWKLEILDGDAQNMRIFLEYIKGCVPGLRAMTRQQADAVALSGDLPPDLRSLLMSSKAFPLKMAPEVIITLPFLTTLYIISNSIRFPVGKWHLPSLRHLSIECYKQRGSITLQEDLYSFLQSFGSNLHTFHCRGDLESREIDPRFWKALPEVRNIQSPFKWGNGSPRDHPLRSVQITTDDLWRLVPEQPQSFCRITMQAKEYLPSSIGPNFTIRMDTTWYEELFTKSSLFGNGALVLWLHDYCRLRSITLIDAHGDSFPQYIVFLITASRGSNLRSYRWNCYAELGF